MHSIWLEFKIPSQIYSHSLSITNSKATSVRYRSKSMTHINISCAFKTAFQTKMTRVNSFDFHASFSYMLSIYKIKNLTIFKYIF